MRKPMNTTTETIETIDHATLEHLAGAGAGAIREASVVGQPGGWGVVFHDGTTERALAVKRADTSERMRKAHEAAAHDAWFRAQVAHGLQEADDPKTQWVSNEAVKATSAQRRSAWLKKAQVSVA
jgi:hypothetical protein